MSDWLRPAKRVGDTTVPKGGPQMSKFRIAFVGVFVGVLLVSLPACSNRRSEPVGRGHHDPGHPEQGRYIECPQCHAMVAEHSLDRHTHEFHGTR